MEEETHVEVDEIWHRRRFVVYFAIGRKTKLILNYHVGDRDYRDVITFLKGIPEEIRNSDKITFVSDAYVNYLNLLPDFVENCIIVNKSELKKRKKKELRKGLGEVNHVERFFATLRCWFAQFTRKSLKIIKSLNILKIKLDLFTYFWNLGVIS
ncbi:MAG: hypothetical protein DSY80_06040 [Desulfocapsa sp.]|nr:MAG: hypothetical protein DSY80_06040 [Desulfocapsa sp.]